MSKAVLILSLLILTTLGVAPENHYTQTQCSLAERVDYPVDITQFTLAQTFSVPSPRHQGRYHTGEDWFAGRENTSGLPVRAIAAGRVTYSFPMGWGRDGGVVIIEHTFADGAVVYSQYGHMTETDSAKFPQRLSCVEAGQIIGAIGNARPAPHLHIEIKLGGADTPGPGYSWANPYDEGWRSPSKFILNRQAWSSPAHRWHLVLSDPNGFRSTPLQLDDQSLMYLDGQALKLATDDGRVLWRVLLNQPAVAVIGYQRQPLVVYADGTMQTVDYNGNVIDNWTLQGLDGKTLTADWFEADDQLLFHTTDNTLIAVSENRREVLWMLEEVPPFVRAHVTPQMIALLTASDQLLLLSRDGDLRETVSLRGVANFATGEDGALVVFNRGGLWRVDSAGDWELLIEQPKAQTDSNAVLLMDHGRAFTYDGAVLNAYAFNTEQWSLPLPMTGKVLMSMFDSTLVVTSAHGQIMAVDDSGVLCGAVRVYGDDRAVLWQSLDETGILRVGVGDQVIGIDWQRFTQPCDL